MRGGNRCPIWQSVYTIPTPSKPLQPCFSVHANPSTPRHSISYQISQTHKYIPYTQRRPPPVRTRIGIVQSPYGSARIFGRFKLRARARTSMRRRTEFETRGNAHRGGTTWLRCGSSASIPPSQLHLPSRLSVFPFHPIIHPSPTSPTTSPVPRTLPRGVYRHPLFLRPFTVYCTIRNIPMPN